MSSRRRAALLDRAWLAGFAWCQLPRIDGWVGVGSAAVAVIRTRNTKSRYLAHFGHFGQPFGAEQKLRCPATSRSSKRECKQRRPLRLETLTLTDARICASSPLSRRGTMGKPIPITLPNGRTWPKKGDAEAHFKAILGRHALGARVVDPSDHDDLAALLKVYDAVVPAGESTKAGASVAYFEKRADVDHPGHTACFFVVRKDGTSIDFSLGRALDVAARRSR